MKTVTTLLAVVCFAALTIVPSLQAQDLQTGTWTGTVTPPGGEVFEITYIVENVDDTLKVTMNSPIGPLPLRDIVVGEENLTFSWSANNTDLDCDLKKQDDGRYTGECIDAGGSPGQLVMIPPEEEGEGNP